MDMVREYFEEFGGCAMLIAFKISEDLDIEKYTSEYYSLYNKVKVYAWRINNNKKLLLIPGSNKNVTSPGNEEMKFE